MHLGSGLSVGLAGIAAGYAIGIVGDAVRILMAGGPYRFYTNNCSIGRAFLHAAVTSICWHDLDFDLRGSPGALWVGF